MQDVAFVLHQPKISTPLDLFTSKYIRYKLLTTYKLTISLCIVSRGLLYSNYGLSCREVAEDSQMVLFKEIPYGGLKSSAFGLSLTFGTGGVTTSGYRYVTNPYFLS